VTLKQNGPGGLKDALKGVSAQIPVGTLTGVLGPPGSGQAELFSVIHGTEAGFCEGRVPVQDRVAFLSQNPNILPSDTVDDILWFYANLRMPRETTRDEKECVSPHNTKRSVWYLSAGQG
jgi:ABC-type multidrug transport system ATPase subunit